jgi:hypothetical protein
MKQIFKYLFLIIVAILLAGCGGLIQAQNNLASSMNNSPVSESTQLQMFHCKGHLLKIPAGDDWRAHIRYIGETEKNIFVGGGVISVKSAATFPKGEFMCIGQGQMTINNFQINEQAVQQTIINLDQLQIIVDGDESGKVDFDTAMVVGTSFKGSDEELQAFLATNSR